MSTDEELKIEQELRDIYYDPLMGYQSAEKLYQKAKSKGLKVTQKMVKKWLKTQDTYTRFKPFITKHKFQKTWVKDLADQIQMDLVDMKKYSRQNKGYYWILTCVEILSRYAFAIPVYRKDTKNMIKAVEELLKQFHNRFDKYSKFAQFDEGKEFYNVGVRQLLKEYNIEYFSTAFGSKKASIVERFNRTLKTSMWKYFYNEDTNNWLDVLDSLVKNYNNTKHRSILMKPVDVNEENKHIVWTTLFGHPLGKLPLPKFKIGDTVRIADYKPVFTKGYEANYTEEIYKIRQVFRGDLNTYKLEDLLGDEISGKFYEQELSAVNKKDDMYKVEKILRRKKNMVYVKWKGYDNKHNCWIPESSIHK